MKTLTFKNIIATLSMTCFSIFAVAAEPSESLQEQLKKMQNRVDEIEMRESFQTFKWSGVFINRAENFKNEVTPTTGPVDVTNINAWSTSVELNLESKLNEKVAFYGSVGMSKLWNNSGRLDGGTTNNSSGWSQSQTGSYGLGGSTAMFDRAYLTYKFDSPFTLSIGRLSTNMGPPIEQLDGLAQQGTYPRLAYNAIFDGVALSYDAKAWLPSDQSLRLTAFYTPFVNIDSSDRTKQSVVPSTTSKIDSTNNQYTVLAAYELKNTAIANKISLDYFFYSYESFYSYSSAGYLSAMANMGYLGLSEIAGTNLSFSFSTLNVATTQPNVNLKVSSNAYLTTLSYMFSGLNNLIVGGEYITTDQYYYLDEWTRLDIIPFYSQPNERGYHLYISKSLGNSLTGRIGYYSLKSEAFNNVYSGASDPKEMHSTYASLRFDF